MHEQGINPYQPVALDPAADDDSLGSDVSFRLTHALLRHAEAQYLLHWHPWRLLLGSLAMIAISCGGIWFSLQSFSTLEASGAMMFLATLVGMMIVCSLIYLALVHQSKLRIRQRLREHGLIHQAVCSVTLAPEDLSLQSPAGEFRWETERVSVYRTKKGLLLCPEPLLFIFVPKQTDASSEAFDVFRVRAEELVGR